MLGLLGLLLFGLGVGWAILVAHTAWLLTHPPRRGYAFAVSRGMPGDPSEIRAPAAPEGLRFSQWTLRTADELDLPVWDIQGGDPSGPAIIITHGWGDARVVMLPRIASLAPSASRIIAWDLRGHSDAPGSCRLGTREVDDLIRLVERVDSPALILYGFSLGAGVSVAAASRLGARIAGVVAEAPYRLAATPARNMLDVRALPHRGTLLPALSLVRACSTGADLTDARFDRVAFARALHADTRLLVIVGEHDQICPVEEARDIADAGRGELLVVPGGMHTDLWLNPTSAPSVQQWVARWFARAALPGGVRSEHAPDTVRL